MNSDIIEINNFLSNEEFNYLINKINSFTYDDNFPGWKFSGYSNLSDEHKKFWYLNVENDDYFSSFLFGKIKKFIFETENKEVKVEAIYLNGATFGQQGYLHTDNIDDNRRTFLVYCNSEWNVEWAGGTVFSVDTHNITVYPKPGNAIYFKGKIPHFSQAVSKDFCGLRITLAYKLYLIDDDE